LRANDDTVPIFGGMVSVTREGAMPIKLRDKNKALAAVAVVAFATHPGRARAGEAALKARLKQLEAEIVKQKRERKDARGPCP
jgi:hypothetical protein